MANLYRQEVQGLFESYREQISDIMYVYHFHSEVDLICKFDSQQQNMSKQFDIADSAQVELNHLITRIRNLMDQCQLKNYHQVKCLCEDCDEHRMARASACYIVTYEQQYAKKILSFPWLFSSWLVKLRRTNLQKENLFDKTPSNYFLVGQAFLHSFRLLIDNQSLRLIVDFQRDFCLLRMNFDHRMKKFIYIPVRLMDWAMIEVVTGWLDRQEIFSTGKYSSKTAMKPMINLRTWKHITTQFLFDRHKPKSCSQLLLLQNRFLQKQQVTVTYENGATGKTMRTILFESMIFLVALSLPQFNSAPSISSIPPIEDWWSDERACRLYRVFLKLTAQCSRTHTASNTAERMDMAHLNEYLTLGLLSIAAENEFGNIIWQ